MWIKNVFMIVFLLVWSITMLVLVVVQKTVPEPLLWGMPGGLWALLYPGFRKNGSGVEPPAIEAEAEGKA
jgi:hypothetical protein